MRWPTASAVALALVAGIAAPVARAHVYATPTYVATGSTSSIELSLPNERQVPMTAFELRMPTGMRIVEAMPARGWSGSSTERRATWTGRLPAFRTANFTVRIETRSAPGSVTLRAVERYPDGGTRNWPVTLLVVPADKPSEQLGAALVVGLLGLLGLTIGGAYLWRRTGRTLQEK
jgi:hypothetical protein